jgi:hypothetical protein
MFGRLDEARQEARLLRGWYASPARLAIAVTAGEWDRAESLAVAIGDDSSLPQHVRDLAVDVRIAAATGRGARENAHTLLEQGQRQAELREDADRIHAIALRQLLLHQAFRAEGIEPARSARSDTSVQGRVALGLAAAFSGDLVSARRISATLRATRQADTSDSRVGPAVLEGWLIGEGGDWMHAARILSPLAKRGEGPDRILGPPLVRWLAAEAFARSQQPDSAALFYELALSPERLDWERRLDIRMITAAAHQQRGFQRQSSAAISPR